MAGMSVRKVQKARRLVTGLAAGMVKKEDTSASTAALAKRARGEKPLSPREKAKVAKRVINNQAKKASNLKASNPEARKAIADKMTIAGRAGGLDRKTIAKVRNKSYVKAVENNMSRNYKAVVKSEKARKAAAKTAAKKTN